MANGQPIRLHVCDHLGSCIPLKSPLLTIQGSVVEIRQDQVSDLIEELGNAEYELELDQSYSLNPSDF